MRLLCTGIVLHFIVSRDIIYWEFVHKRVSCAEFSLHDAA
jgi:hypothetical protein